ncbi:DEKNAAC103446 [Brettanomyces naardenensis]|uniref:protein S-acyltransferase n=1 Tax=Brettanomyces naardenensis TaxID=13370 RepID=A0A448YP22_BRENA|nr:DEKNAAC103446 [Brettanomyces naardenensis]
MSEDTTEIHRAVMDGNIMTLKGLLAENPSLALLKDQDSRTPLHWACSFQRLDMVEILLNPSDIVGVKDIVGSTNNSVQSPHQQKALIDIDDLADESGWTPLHIASSVGNLQIVKALIEHKPTPDVNQQTTTGQTCLHYAVSKNHFDVTDYLIKECKASTRIKDKKGQYPLHRAAAVGSLRMCKTLIEDGKSPLSVKDIYGFTPLHHALAEGHGDVAIYLVKAGADYNAEDNEGKTPYEDSLNDKVKRYFKRQMEEEGYDI